jgi:hypothetical protein
MKKKEKVKLMTDMEIFHPVRGIAAPEDVILSLA